MTPAAPNRYLHVANGHATTRLIEQAGFQGALSIWADVLHDGPVPAGLSDEELVTHRFEGWGPETVGEMHALLAAIDDDQAYDELILWYEHDLFDQLALIQLLSRIGRTLPRATPVSLICVGSFPGRPAFKGLGELTPGELAPLFESRQRVTDAQCTVAARAWLAFRAPDPRRIEDLLGTDTTTLPFLGEALRRHLEEFPWTTDGLSRTERRLMELAQPGPVDLWAAFPRMHDLETAFYIPDTSFWDLVDRLASSSPPLVAVEITARNPRQLPRGTVSVTGAGSAVLQGGDDRVRRCGLDRWLGGVHLEGSGVMWRWDPAAHRIVNV